MKIITTTMRVRRYLSRLDFSGHQDLVRETRLFGIRIWSRVVDTEDVPSWHSIMLATLGYGGWASRFAEHIDRATKSGGAS